MAAASAIHFQTTTKQATKNICFHRNFSNEILLEERRFADVLL